MTLKKALVAITVVAMLFGMVGMAFAATPSDIVGTKYQASVNRLMALGVIAGMPDGTYQPAASLTRAQAAAIIVRALGLDQAAQIAKGGTAFSDVSADHWASGYINIASSRGVIKGVGDGKFDPEAQLTYAQWVTMLVRALGYEPLVIGGYPGGYIAKGVELGLLNGITVAGGGSGFIPRGDVAIMTDTAVTKVDLVAATTYTDKVQYTIQPGVHLATSVLGVTEDKGWIVYSTSDTDDTLGANQFKAYNPNGAGSGTFTVNDGAYDNVGSLLGQLVTFGTKVFTVGITDQTKVIYVNQVTTSDKIVSGTVDSSVYSVNGTAPNTWNSLYSIDVFVGSATTSTHYVAAGNNDVVRNWRYADPNSLLGGDSVTLTLDDNGKVIFAQLNGYSSSNSVVSKVVQADAAKSIAAEIDYKVPGSLASASYSGTQFADNLVVIRNGKRAAFSDIAAGDIVRFTTVGGTVTSVEATTSKVSGTIDTVKYDGTTLSVAVGGTTYKAETGATYKANSGASEAVISPATFNTAAAGTAADLYLGFDGKVRFAQLAPVANTVTGYVLSSANNKAYLENNAIVTRDNATVLTTAGATQTVLFDTTYTGSAPTAGSIVTINLNAAGYGTGFAAAAIDPTANAVASVSSTAKTLTVGSKVYYFTDSTVVFDETGADVAAGSIASLAAGQVVNLSTTGLTINDVVIAKSAPVTGVVVADYTTTTSSGAVNYLDVLTAGGVKTVSYTAGSAAAGDLISYQVAGGAATFGLVPGTVTGTVYSIDTTTNTFYIAAGGTNYAVTPATLIINASDTTAIAADVFGSVAVGTHVEFVVNATATNPQAIDALIIRP